MSPIHIYRWALKAPFSIFKQRRCCFCWVEGESIVLAPFQNIIQGRLHMISHGVLDHYQ